MIIGVGLDICAIERFADEQRRLRFMRRFFSEGEQGHVVARGMAAAECAAGIFAAKEAAIKAMGVGLGNVPLTDIFLEYSVEGAPRLALSGKAKERADAMGVSRWHVSVSHDGGVAMAIVILEG